MLFLIHKFGRLKQTHSKSAIELTCLFSKACYSMLAPSLYIAFFSLLKKLDKVVNMSCTYYCCFFYLRFYGINDIVTSSVLTSLHILCRMICLCY